MTKCGDLNGQNLRIKDRNLPQTPRVQFRAYEKEGETTGSEYLLVTGFFFQKQALKNKKKCGYLIYFKIEKQGVRLCHNQTGMSCMFYVTKTKTTRKGKTFMVCHILSQWLNRYFKIKITKQPFHLIPVSESKIQ